MANRTVTRAHALPAAAAAILMATAPLAIAQTTTPATPAATSPAPSSNADKASGGLQMSHNAWRSTKLDGVNVYDEHGDAIGTVDDMLLDSSGKVSNVVLSVGGFLGVGSKYVEVPFSHLKFEPSKNNGSNHDYSVVLPGVTKDSLKAMTSFSY